MSESFLNYLRFVSDMLGGDILPLVNDGQDVDRLIAEQAIDYELMQQLVKNIRLHNSVIGVNDLIVPYPTLDALGELRGKLLRQRGDVNQISLIDRIGELTVSYFNLSPRRPRPERSDMSARLLKIK